MPPSALTGYDTQSIKDSLPALPMNIVITKNRGPKMPIVMNIRVTWAFVCNPIAYIFAVNNEIAKVVTIIVEIKII